MAADSRMQGTVLVTGGTHGIGRETVGLLSASGWRVAFVGRDREAGESIEKEGMNRLYIHADVGRLSDIRTATREAIDFGGGELQGLVNNAGRSLRQSFRKATAADWSTVMNTNARSAFLFMRYCLGALILGHGSVVNVASVAGLFGESGLAIYSASKAGLIALTKSLALEHGRQVRFNAVCPGQIATRMMARVTTNPVLSKATAAQIPLGRLAEPSEVAAAISWLLSASASYVNGAVLVVDGGQTAGNLGTAEIQP
jgi:NAD(P)-dependent dehydrogenase (short-subunit alcohol dehydrogenase family)